MNIYSKNFNSKATVKEKQYDLQAISQTGFRELVHQISCEIEKIKKNYSTRLGQNFDQNLVAAELLISAIDPALKPAEIRSEFSGYSSANSLCKMASSKYRNKKREASTKEHYMPQHVKQFDLVVKHLRAEKKPGPPYRSRPDIDNQEVFATSEIKDLKDNSKQQGGKKILLSYFSSQREKFAPDSETNLIPSSSKHLLKGQQPDDTASRSAAIKTQPKKPLAFKLLSYAIGFFIKSFKERRNVGCSNQRRPRRTTGASKGVYGCATSSPRPKAALPPK